VAGFSGVLLQAAEIAAIAAKTVSRIDLLIFFFPLFDRKASFRGSRDRILRPPPQVLVTQPDAEIENSTHKNLRVLEISTTLRSIERGRQRFLQEFSLSWPISDVSRTKSSKTGRFFSILSVRIGGMVLARFMGI